MIFLRTAGTNRLLRMPAAPPLLRHPEGLERTGGHVMPGLAAERTSAAGMAFADMLKKHGIGRRRAGRGGGIRKNAGLSFHGFQRSLMSDERGGGSTGRGRRRMSRRCGTLSDERARRVREVTRMTGIL